MSGTSEKTVWCMLRRRGSDNRPDDLIQLGRCTQMSVAPLPFRDEFCACTSWSRCPCRASITLLYQNGTIKSTGWNYDSYRTHESGSITLLAVMNHWPKATTEFFSHCGLIYRPTEFLQWALLTCSSFIRVLRLECSVLLLTSITFASFPFSSAPFSLILCHPNLFSRPLQCNVGDAQNNTKHME